MGDVLDPLPLKEAVYASGVTVGVFVMIVLLPYVAGQLTPFGMTLQSGTRVVRLASPFFVLVFLLVVLQPD